MRSKNGEKIYSISDLISMSNMFNCLLLTISNLIYCIVHTINFSQKMLTNTLL